MQQSDPLVPLAVGRLQQTVCVVLEAVVAWRLAQSCILLVSTVLAGCGQGLCTLQVAVGVVCD